MTLQEAMQHFIFLYCLQT